MVVILFAPYSHTISCDCHNALFIVGPARSAASATVKLIKPHLIDGNNQECNSVCIPVVIL